MTLDNFNVVEVTTSSGSNCPPTVNAFGERHDYQGDFSEKDEEISEISLRDLRISLFFYFRAIRHSQTEPNKDLINIHLDLIRKRL